MSDDPFAIGGILELMGHRRLGGFIEEVQIAGASFLRIDIHGGEGVVTQFYAPGAVYALTPTDEETARAIAQQVGFEPVNPWDLRLALGQSVKEGWDGDDDQQLPF